MRLPTLPGRRSSPPEPSRPAESAGPFVAGGGPVRRHHRLMFWRRLKLRRGGVDWLTALFAALGVIGALSLAAILVIYILDDEPDRQASPTAPGAAAQRPAQTQTQPAPVPDGAPAAPTAPPAPGAQPDQPRSNRIPENQSFETFRNRAAGYSILAPKGWAEKRSGQEVSFENNRNYVRVAINDVRPARTLAQQRAILRSEVKPPDRAGQVKQVTVAGQRAVTSDLLFNRNQPNTLLVRRYFFARGGKQATIDLATPQGQAFSNEKHYQRVINSFRWT